MKPHPDKRARLQQMLRQVYRLGADGRRDDSWPEEAMRRIRAIGPLPPEPEWSYLFGRFVWRFSPAAGVLIVISAVLLMGLDLWPASTLLTSYFTGGQEIEFVQLFPLAG